MAKLVFRSGPLRGHVLAVEKERVSIGRDARNDVAIADDIISSFHAAIIREPDSSYWIEDLGSKNGTFLNGNRVERERLKEGDVLHLCQSGPEIQFTAGVPVLPSIIESSTATFARTGSVTQALKELLPLGSKGLSRILNLTGVRRILDFQLEEVTHRSRKRFAALVMAFFVLSALALGATIYLELRRAGHGVGVATPKVEETLALPVKLTASLDPIFGSLFLSYRDSPIGQAQVTNLGKDPLKGCELNFLFQGSGLSFLVEPFSTSVPEIPPGSAVTVPIAPKLSTDVLSDQTRQVGTSIALKKDGKTVAEVSRSIFVHSRHVLNWEKPERIAAFVDQDDPAVVEFKSAVWAHRPPMSRQEFPPPHVVGALTLLTALAEQGLRYLPDGKNPISERIEGKTNDSVSYPGETLLSRAGDCDDLSVLCCAILESAGIPTAFVVGSGHVLFCFDTGIGAAGLPGTPFDPETLVVRGEQVWMPIEATDFARPGATFASAWSAAWPRVKAISSGEMHLIELREAWQTYQPMNPPPDARMKDRIARAEWASPDLKERIGLGLESLKKLFHENLEHRVAEIMKEEEEGPARTQAIGLLYSRSGLFDDARRVFERALFGEAGPPEMKGLGEVGARLTDETAILLSDLGFCMALGARSPEDLHRAAGYTEIALSGLPDGASREKGELMLRLSLIHRLRGDLSAERSWSSRAFELDPILRSVYQTLIAPEGAVAGPEERILEFLRKGLR